MADKTLHNYLSIGKTISDNTSLEISSQPELWKKTYQTIQNQKDRIIKFLNLVYSQKGINIILTGAGSSAFIGDSLQGPFQKSTGILTRSISSTTLVTHPELFLQKDTPTLLISFARSGDSPESIAVINLVHKICSVDYHLIITCNPSGKLVTEIKIPKSLIILLPEETNDKGLAMTGSFTSMLLSGILISRINQLDMLNPQIDRLISYGENILNNYTEKLRKLASMKFNRAVFLGSGPLLGIARESHLKLQELTNGRIICKNDSYLGFRHGPKSVIDKKTIVIYLFSNNKYVGQFEDDLVKEICRQELALYSVGVRERPKKDYCLNLDIIMSESGETIDEAFLAICYILPAQILGYFKSIELGLDPDNPSESGIIGRVVQGVNIYSYD